MPKKLSKSQLYLIEGSLIECIEKAKAIQRIPNNQIFYMNRYSDCACANLLGGTNLITFKTKIKLKFGFTPRASIAGIKADEQLSNIEKDVNTLFAARGNSVGGSLLVSDWIIEAEIVLKRVRKAIKKREKNPEKYP